MKRREPTEEQKAAAKTRREQLYRIAKTVSSMSDEERMTFASRVRVITCEGHPISVFNACMLVTQKPDATVIGGLQQWRRVGRKVRKGEHGAGIFVPKKPGKAEEGSGPQPGEISLESKQFVIVTMFDITQTDAEGDAHDEAHAG